MSEARNLAMGEHLKLIFLEQGDDRILQLIGDIDEYAKFMDLNIPLSARLVFDLKEVRLVNSLGLRNWINWIRSHKDETQIVFRNCPKIVMDQINILDGLLPNNGMVESFEVPFDCDNCGHEEIMMAERGTHFVEGTADTKEGNLIPETMGCPKCGSTMELGVFPAKYFKFLKYRR